MSFIINLVEDEISLLEILNSYLTKENYMVNNFSNGAEAIKNISKEVDLWILDIMLPDADGFEILQKIKDQNKETPVIFISARDRDIDRVVGLEMGADDYLPKPFLPRELVIRVNKLIQRIYGRSKKIESEIKLECYIINLKKRLVFEGNNQIELTTREFDLLQLFSKNLGTPFSREQLINSVWGEQYYTSERVVDDLIRRLRSKLNKLPLETVYGYGYRMNR